MIRGGKYCPECSNELAAKFQSAMGNPFATEVMKKQETKTSARMRFLDK